MNPKYFKVSLHIIDRFCFLFPFKEALAVKEEGRSEMEVSSLPVDFEAKNGDASLITEAMKQEEEILAVKEEVSSEMEVSSLPMDFEAKNGDASLITEAMKQEEEKLQEARAKEEEEAAKSWRLDPNFKFSKLDELLTQTQLYSEFLLERMEHITANEVKQDEEEEKPKEKQKGRGRKRKASSANQYNDNKAKKAVAVMLRRSCDTVSPEDSSLTEAERCEKEQKKLVPLMTGGRLKSYQIKGVKWMISLWHNGLNGILADQMGLGKTVQTIGFLAHLKGEGLHGPYMVIAPLSTLSNWINEVARFAPSMSTIIYHGNKYERADIRRKHMPKQIGPKFPLVVTSYEMALADARFLSHYQWKYVVVDEGHRLKNTNCKLMRELRRIPMENKLLLTGTPLQNNLAELWSLLNFILPDIFSSQTEFESWYVLKISLRQLVISKLHGILRPFLLRRMKVDVEQNLPKKKEIILYANMTNRQKEIQDHLINKTFHEYVENSKELIMKPGMRGKLSNLLVQLRKNWSEFHLYYTNVDLLHSIAYISDLFYPPINELLEQCGKYRLMDRLLSLLLAQKHKAQPLLLNNKLNSNHPSVLIFSQWTKVLDILDYYLAEKNLEVCRIDGSVKLAERKRQIDLFNDMNSNLNIFLLSTRAGGLGINLTAADTCILYDSDWNPQCDLQAMDRCHRIGQTKPVHVYRLATANSVEGRIIKRAFGKLKLEHVVIGKGEFHQDRVKANTFEDEELLALLRDDPNDEDKLIQTDISDDDLLRVADRSDLVGPSGSCNSVLPVKGPGWEVVIPARSGGSVLSSLNS
ncbi:ATP-dependent DNA helicase DDM1 [Carex littledalei]|uniref:ATP-dependent DNA helicase DDM1 n=1 Tax=Carex littledalei TaxID=544730 RepID=A0A833QCA6_9POAL|nr:ATP-dependent DNA helicase DDM1 [Carex littledalei]